MDASKVTRFKAWRDLLKQYGGRWNHSATAHNSDVFIHEDGRNALYWTGHAWRTTTVGKGGAW